ncbi:MAG: winged helix-turn-helix domain-containing protein, partial [Candidatus Odinarchaeia archaeon]
ILKKSFLKQPYSTSNFEKYYLEPLYDAGLITITDSKVEITQIGIDVLKFIKQFNVPSVFLKSQKCYEELILLELKKRGEASISDLVDFVPYNCLIRAINRLKNYIRITSSESYRKLLKIKTSLKNPTDLRIIKIFKNQEIISVKEIMKMVPVHPRTVYKSLKRLEENNVIARIKHHKVYSLNSEGENLVSFLNSLIKISEMALSKEIKFAYLIVECLLKRNYAVTEREIFEECFNSDDVDEIKFSIQEFNKIRNDLKSAGLIIGNIYMGYTPSKELLNIIKKISPTEGV